MITLYDITYMSWRFRHHLLKSASTFPNRCRTYLINGSLYSEELLWWHSLPFEIISRQAHRLYAARHGVFICPLEDDYPSAGRIVSDVRCKGQHPQFPNQTLCKNYLGQWRTEISDNIFIHRGNTKASILMTIIDTLSLVCVAGGADYSYARYDTGKVLNSYLLHTLLEGFHVYCSSSSPATKIGRYILSYDFSIEWSDGGRCICSPNGRSPNLFHKIPWLDVFCIRDQQDENPSCAFTSNSDF